MRSANTWLRHPIDSLAARFLRSTMAQIRPGVHHGVAIRVAPLEPELTPANVYSVVARALSLLAESRPQVLARLRKDAVGILVHSGLAGGRAAGAYAPQTKLILLDARYFMAAGESQAAFPAAATIVHEATHARLDVWLRGRRPCAGRALFRIEELCYRQELAFVSQLRNTERVQARLRMEIKDIARMYSHWARLRRIMSIPFMRGFNAPPGRGT